MTKNEINAEKAVKIAKEYLMKSLDNNPFHLSVEEIELKGQKWYVTLCYLESFLDSKRTFKEFQISDNDGSILSMKLKNVTK